jgi:hypothetical protein
MRFGEDVRLAPPMSAFGGKYVQQSPTSTRGSVWIEEAISRLGPTGDNLLRLHNQPQFGHSILAIK